MRWNSLPPSMLAEPSSWRRYHWPRVSSSVSSSVNSCVPSGKWPQKMIMNDHRLRVRLAMALPASTSGSDGPAQRREQHVVLQRTGRGPSARSPAASRASRRASPRRRRSARSRGRASRRPTGRSVASSARRSGCPGSTGRHCWSSDMRRIAVADVAILAEDVGEGVVHVVVGVAPLVAGAGGVPLVGLAVQARVLHPVVLAVHHVVADLHVVEDLRHARGRRYRRSRRAAGSRASAGRGRPPRGRAGRG